jgi:hypothetical protein
LESVPNTTGHLIIHWGLLFGIGDRNDEREWLRLEGFCVLNTVSRKEFHHQAPPTASLTGVSQVPIVCTNRCPFPELLNLIGLVENTGIFVLWRNESCEYTFHLARLAGDPILVDTEVCIYMCFAIFTAPPSAAFRSKSDGHPDFSEVSAIALKGCRVRKIIPFEKISGSENIIEHKSGCIWCTLETIWYG